jgi:hypothetical protein
VNLYDGPAQSWADLDFPQALVRYTAEPIVTALFKLFLDICLLRTGPQRVPASTFVLVSTLIVYVSSRLLLMLPLVSGLSAMAQTLLDVALMLILLYLALYWRGMAGRFVQSAAALAGGGTLLAVLGMPLIHWLQDAGALDAAPGTVLPVWTIVPLLLWLVLLGWSVVVIAHILRHSLSVPFWIGALAALGYVVLSQELLGVLFPRGD